MTDQELCAQLAQAIQNAKDYRRALRQREQDLRVRDAALSLKYQASTDQPGTSIPALDWVLPPYLRPGNAGVINKTSWMYHFPFAFDFGPTPTLDSNTKATKTVQVSPDSDFLLLNMSQNFDDETNEAGLLGPYQVIVRDTQSTRQYMNNPVPIQCIGSNSRPMFFDTPLYFPAAAVIQLEISTWLAPGTESMVTTGLTSKFELMLGGLKVPAGAGDASRILRAYFGQP
jgi:hypothetical protein